MDNLTHSLVGAVMGQAGLKKKTGLGMPALIIGANLPDVDAACFFWLEGTEHLGFRRGITHGPPALVILPLILAGILWYYDRWQTKRGKRPEGRLPVHFGWLYGLSFLGALSHPLLDWLNVYGVRFWEPFAPTWAYGDTLFIIDVWLWALLLVSVWWGCAREKSGGNQRPIARGAIAIMLAYIAMNWAITWITYQTKGVLAEPYPTEFIASPEPITSLSRERIAKLEDGRWVSNRWDGDDAGYGYRHSAATQCVLPDFGDGYHHNAQLEAFLFWSRAPMAMRADDGSLNLFDARFYDPLTRDRFTVPVPDLQCEELGSD
ncbi:metal-dependent hydrolase [uncultured Erythrobacter sp.]|uniref:metal-dependent hydrolase n=1 Tax=uncultured Erythrobacter sp. TaxID=263913 RepID=UPI002605CB15|nr:metal-dependent hydrolase [uncultured Erythrobacter sp.]